MSGNGTTIYYADRDQPIVLLEIKLSASVPYLTISIDEVITMIDHVTSFDTLQSGELILLKPSV